MVIRKPGGSLTEYEKQIVKNLLIKGWRNQDIQALVNVGRKDTVNSGRITGVKSDSTQKSTSDVEVERYFRVKKNYDLKTGLNPYLDERLIRARESMLLAVNVFNNPVLQFRSEVFCVLSNIAWTYLLHEHFHRSGLNLIKENGHTIALSELIARPDSPLRPGVRQNLEDMKLLRDKVEHSLLQRSDLLWMSLFQANCLNFDKALCELFDENLTLQNDLSFALHFRKMDLDQLEVIQKFDIPAEIAALNKEMLSSKEKSEKDNL